MFDFWRALAIRMGFADSFPWPTLEDLYDYRLSGTGMRFEEFADKHLFHSPKLQFKKYEKTGFATPTGKVELTPRCLKDWALIPCRPIGKRPGRAPSSRS